MYNITFKWFMINTRTVSITAVYALDLNSANYNHYLVIYGMIMLQLTFCQISTPSWLWPHV